MIVEKFLKIFEYKCFKCGKDLRNADPKDWHLDHTLPVFYLWPLTTKNATLLCKKHNAEKAGKWPSEYYTSVELKKLAVKTGIEYSILAAKPIYNPDAIKQLRNPNYVEELLIKFIRYEVEINKLRNRVLDAAGFDFYENANISSAIVDRANDKK